MRKNSIKFLVLLLLLFCFPVAVAAQSRWTDAATIWINPSSQDGKQQCAVTISAVTGTKKISAQIELLRVGKGTVDTWEATASGRRLYWSSDEITVPSGYTYQWKITADVYVDGRTETVIQYADVP